MAFTRVNSLCRPRTPVGRHITVLATQPKKIGQTAMRPSVIRTDARKVAHRNGPYPHGRVSRSHPLRGKVARVQLTSWLPWPFAAPPVAGTSA